jgi:hypothetical protein
VLSIVYLSVATQPFDDAALADLLLSSRAANHRAGISGVLLHRDGGFIQVLEGPEEAVRSCFARIERDPRHRDIRTLATEVIDVPRFRGWSMGYQPATAELVRDLPGWNDFFADVAVIPTDDRSTKVAALLAWFRNHPRATGATGR